MNNKGFTLIELIATIALLAIIAIISFVSVTKIIEQNKINNCNTIVNNIKTAASEYVSDNRYKNSFVSSDISANADGTYTKIINASILTNGKYLSTPIYNPFDKSEISPSNILLTITLNQDYSAQVVTISSPAALKECKQN